MGSAQRTKSVVFFFLTRFVYYIPRSEAVHYTDASNFSWVLFLGLSKPLFPRELTTSVKVFVENLLEHEKSTPFMKIN
jgi:hypothetical protein